MFSAAPWCNGCADEMKFFGSSAEVEQMAASVLDNGGVCTWCLLSPGWARPTGTRTRAARDRRAHAWIGPRAHRPRRARSDRAYQSADARRHATRRRREIERVARGRRRGGERPADAVQADILGVPVVRPKVLETTALGAAYLSQDLPWICGTPRGPRRALVGGVALRAAYGTLQGR